MLERNREEQSLSETAVKEAVALGLESPLREPILEAVDEADSRSGRGRSLPLAGALFGAGAAIGFAAGRQSDDLETPSIEDVEEPEIIEDVTEDGFGEGETESEDSSEDESSRVPKLLALAGIVAGVAVLWRRFAGEDDEAWEPIEEFEPATADEQPEFGDDEMAAGTDDDGPE